MSKKEGAGLGCAIVGGILTLVVILAFIGLVAGWFNGAAETAGFDNSKAQGTAIRDDYESMQQQAETICDVVSAGRKASDDDDPLIVEDPTLSYKAQYRRTASDYNRRMSNIFEAGKTKALAGVSDLPDRAPSVTEAMDQVCHSG
jgi:hypothetical protein